MASLTAAVPKASAESSKDVASQGDGPQEFQRALLQLAFSSATKLPLDPHLKDRSRLQQRIVDACFTIRAPELALELGDQIRNWRRGMVHAEYALYGVRHHTLPPAETQTHLERAMAIADAVANDPNPQVWRRDRVRAKVAAAWVLAGDLLQADGIAADLEASESFAMASAKAEVLATEDFDAQLVAADRVLEARSFDQVRPMLGVLTQLYGRFYGDLTRREALEIRIEASRKSVPVAFFIQVQEDLVDVRIAHGDTDRAADGVEQLAIQLASARWLPDAEIPMRAQIAVLRHRVGQSRAARSELDETLALYDGTRPQIMGIDRADTLRPLAVAYHQIGARDRALALFQRALAEGADNPNARPRCEDLGKICIALAEHTIRPDAGLWKQLRDVASGLHSPW